MSKRQLHPFWDEQEGLMAELPLFKRETRWVCPNCTEHDVTYEPRPHTRFHSCKGLRGISAPFVEAGVDCKVEARERDDYVGDEIVQHAPLDGRPVMSVVTTRADGSNDVAVFAPMATAIGEA